MNYIGYFIKVLEHSGTTKIILGKTGCADGLTLSVSLHLSVQCLRSALLPQCSDMFYDYLVLNGKAVAQKRLTKTQEINGTYVSHKEIRVHFLIFSTTIHIYAPVRRSQNIQICSLKMFIPHWSFHILQTQILIDKVN